MNMKHDFEKAFEEYWYKFKPIGARLRDSMSEEERICANFFGVLNSIGMLDKVYPIGKE